MLWKFAVVLYMLRELLNPLFITPDDFWFELQYLKNTDTTKQA